MKILLIHQYSGNKGDRAVLYAMCRMLKSAYPSASLVVSTSDSILWSDYSYYKENDITFVPWGWDYITTGSKSVYWSILKKIQKYTFSIMREGYIRDINLSKFFSNPLFYKAVKEADIVISVGGHHFTTILSRDLVSGINFDAMIASANKKLICFSQSFGQFNFYNERNKKLTQRILSKSFLMPREEESHRELRNFLGQDIKMAPTYESVLSLSRVLQYLPISHRDDAVGIAIYCTQARSIEQKETYQKSIADLCNHAISKGYKVRFFPMEMKGSLPDDRPFIQEIVSHVTHPEQCYVYDKDMETLAHIQEVSRCKVFVGHKTHSTIFALASGTPLIAIAYHPKTEEFLHQFGMSENVIDDKHLTTSWLCERFDDMMEKLDVYSQQQYAQSVSMTQQIEKDLKSVIDSAIVK